MLVEVIVKAEVEEVVNQKFAQIAAIPLQNARKKHDEESVCSDTSIFVIIESVVAAEALQD
jgi:hypothetical protein